MTNINLGQKRAPEQTTLFKDLNKYADMGSEDDDSDEEFKGPARPVVNMGQRRQYATHADETAAIERKQQEALKAQKKPRAEVRKRRVIEESDPESREFSDSDAEDEESEGYMEWKLNQRSTKMHSKVSFKNHKMTEWLSLST